MSYLAAWILRATGAACVDLLMEEYRVGGVGHGDRAELIRCAIVDLATSANEYEAL